MKNRRPLVGKPRVECDSHLWWVMATVRVGGMEVPVARPFPGPTRESWETALWWANKIARRGHA